MAKLTDGCLLVILFIVAVLFIIALRKNKSEGGGPIPQLTLRNAEYQPYVKFVDKLNKIWYGELGRGDALASWFQKFASPASTGFLQSFEGGGPNPISITIDKGDSDPETAMGWETPVPEYNVAREWGEDSDWRILVVGTGPVGLMTCIWFNLLLGMNKKVSIIMLETRTSNSTVVDQFKIQGSRHQKLWWYTFLLPSNYYIWDRRQGPAVAPPIGVPTDFQRRDWNYGADIPLGWFGTQRGDQYRITLTYVDTKVVGLPLAVLRTDDFNLEFGPFFPRSNDVQGRREAIRKFIYRAQLRFKQLRLSPDICSFSFERIFQHPDPSRGEISISYMQQRLIEWITWTYPDTVKFSRVKIDNSMDPFNNFNPNIIVDASGARTVMSIFKKYFNMSLWEDEQREVPDEIEDIYMKNLKDYGNPLSDPAKKIIYEQSADQQKYNKEGKILLGSMPAQSNVNIYGLIKPNPRYVIPNFSPTRSYKEQLIEWAGNLGSPNWAALLMAPPYNMNPQFRGYVGQPLTPFRKEQLLLSNQVQINGVADLSIHIANNIADIGFSRTIEDPPPVIFLKVGDALLTLPFFTGSSSNISIKATYYCILSSIGVLINS